MFILDYYIFFILDLSIYLPLCIPLTLSFKHLFIICFHFYFCSSLSPHSPAHFLSRSLSLHLNPGGPICTFNNNPTQLLPPKVIQSNFSLLASLFLSSIQTMIISLNNYSVALIYCLTYARPLIVSSVGLLSASLNPFILFFQ